MSVSQKFSKISKGVGDFKKFISRGNVVDMAVGVIIGAAFGKIVSSLVNDILMPFVGIFLGGVDFSALSVCPDDHRLFDHRIYDLCCRQAFRAAKTQ